jgi:hypothetical protein
VTSHVIPEVQLVYISTSYNGGPATEVQTVVCDASGGTFRLNFAGYNTNPIAYNAAAADIRSALMQLQVIDDVDVAFVGSVTQACNSRAVYPTGGFTVTFTAIVGMTGDLPLMTSYTNSLQGLRYVNVAETTRGSAPISGTFRLSFMGSATVDIDVSASDSTFASALGDLDTIPFGGVTVSRDTVTSNTNNHLWRITFSSLALGGNVDALQVVTYYNRLTGSDVAISVFTDGQETSAQRGFVTSGSVKGNELSGYFKLNYRGHITDQVAYNAADTVVKELLEALPNIGTVNVVRTGPSAWQEYS